MNIYTSYYIHKHQGISPWTTNCLSDETSRRDVCFRCGPGVQLGSSSAGPAASGFRCASVRSGESGTGQHAPWAPEGFLLGESPSKLGINHQKNGGIEYGSSWNGDIEPRYADLSIEPGPNIAGGTRPQLCLGRNLVMTHWKIRLEQPWILTFSKALVEHCSSDKW